MLDNLLSTKFIMKIVFWKVFDWSGKKNLFLTKSFVCAFCIEFENWLNFDQAFLFLKVIDFGLSNYLISLIKLIEWNEILLANSLIKTY